MFSLQYDPYGEPKDLIPASAPGNPPTVDLGGATSSCDALANSKVVPTTRFATVTYAYEAAINADADIDGVKSQLESKVSKLVERDLMGCNDDSEGGGRRGLQASEVEVVGVDPLPADELSEKPCTYFAGKDEIEGSNCHVIDGGMTLYLRDGGEPTDGEESDLLERSTVDALEVIVEAMNGKEGLSPFLEGRGNYGVADLLGIRFRAGVTHKGKKYDTDTFTPLEDDAPSDEALPDNSVLGATRAVQSSTFEVAGYSLLGVGLATLFALGIALFVVRKRRREGDGESYDKFKEDEDVSRRLDDEEERRTEALSSHDDLSLTLSSVPASLDSTASASTSLERGGLKQAYVLGEERPIYSNANSSALSQEMARHLRWSFESGSGDDDERQVDVDHCTSAGAKSIDGKKKGGIDKSQPVRGLEISYIPFDSKDLQSPKFENPSEIERPYVVENTVEF